MTHHDVFVSHSTKDAEAAKAVCHALESEKIRCWVAPRDIQPGETWSGAIVDAISNAQLMLLIYSENSNLSKQVLREVERAVAKDVPILPFRISDTPMSKDMEYFLSTPHWLDAIDGELQDHLAKMRETVKRLLGDDSAKGADPKTSPPTSAPPATDRTSNGSATHQQKPEKRHSPKGTPLSPPQAQPSSSSTAATARRPNAPMLPSPGRDGKGSRSISWRHAAWIGSGLMVIIAIAVALAMRGGDDGDPQVATNERGASGNTPPVANLDHHRREDPTDSSAGTNSEGNTATEDFPLGMPQPEPKEPIPSPEPQVSILEPETIDYSRPISISLERARPADQTFRERLLFKVEDDWHWPYPLGTFDHRGDPVMALPGFRPDLRLDTHTRLILQGPSRVNFPPRRDGHFIEIPYGRILLDRTGSDETDARASYYPIRVDQFEATLQLPPNGTVGIAVERTAPTADPAQGLPPARVGIYCMGSRECQLWIVNPPSPKEISLSPGNALFVSSPEAPPLVKKADAPSWLTEPAESDLDCSTAFPPPIQASPSGGLLAVLKEAANDRRVEVRAAAAVMLVQLDHPLPALGCISDASMRSYWPEIFDALQQASWRSPESAQSVKRALQQEFGDDSAELYRMLWGYSPEQIQNGSAGQLVDYLEHEQLAYRVLAFENLRHITGVTLLYSAEQADARRERSVRRWKEKLAAGEIRHLQSSLTPAEE